MSNSSYRVLHTAAGEEGSWDDDRHTKAASKIQKFARRIMQLRKEDENRMGKDQREQLEKGELQPYAFQTVRFLMHPVSEVKDPGQWLGMTGELFLLVVLVSLVITKFMHPEVFTDNPLLEAWGYNNVCVIFDLPPARYVAAVSWIAVTYCAVEYVKLVTHRIFLENRLGRMKKHSRALDYFFVFNHLGYAFTNAAFILCFLIPPTHSRQWHTRPFLAYIVFTWTSKWACVKEGSLDKDPRTKNIITQSTWIYLWVYGIASLYLVISAEVTYWHHDKHPTHGPFFPWQLSFAVDWGWMLLTGLGSTFLPVPPLLIDGVPYHPNTLQNLQNKFRKSKSKRKGGKCCGICRSRGYAAIDLRPEEKHLGEEEVNKTTKLAALFAKKSCEVLEKDPTMASELRCGLTASVLKCRLTIDERVQKLHRAHRRGLFVKEGSYDGFVRINVTENGASRLSIRLEVPESMEVLDECETEKTQSGLHQVDLLMAEGLKQFFVPDATALHQFMKVVDDPKQLLQNLALVVSGVMGFQKALKDLDNTKGFCGKSYYSGVPFQLGHGVCKFGLVPRQADPLAGEEVPGGQPGASLIEKEEEAVAKYSSALVSKIKSSGGAPGGFEWDFLLQVGMRHRSHDLAEGDSEWDESVSPYEAVGKLTIFPEPAFAGGIAGQGGPGLYFNPWNQLKAHRPVGPINLARYQVYHRHWKARKDAGGGLQQDRVCPFLSSVGVA